jgi:GntR family transcriptional regulator, transcriptional repressor for pyruvate dehydrogenase complex
MLSPADRAAQAAQAAQAARPASASPLELVEDYIRRGGFRPGDRLPSEREFSELLGFSRTAVREAVKRLNQKGLVRSSVGRGLFVADPSSGAVGASLDTVLHLQGGTVGHVFEMRHVLGSAAARLAAAHATPADLDAMRAPLEEMLREYRTPNVLRRAGTAFHLALARASHNPLLAALTEPVMRVMDRTRELTPLHGGPSQRGALGHKRIYDAVAAGDADGAAGAMEDHLRYFEARLDASYAGWRELPVPAAE